MPIDTLVADPAFQGLDASKKREVLSRFDPSFSRLTDDQIGEFSLKATKSFNADAAQNAIDKTQPRPGTLKGKKSIEVPRPLDDQIADMYSIIGGIGGEYVGGPPGAMAGAGIGETIKQIPTIMNALKGKSPETQFPLQPNPNPRTPQPPAMTPDLPIDTDSLKGAIGSIISESLMQGGFSKGAKWMGNIGAELKASIKNHSSLERILGNLPIEGDALDAAALEKSGMPHTVGQKTGNSTLNWIEGATAPKGQRVALKNAQNQFIDEKVAQFNTRFGVPAGPGSKPYSDLGDMSQTKILQRQAAAKKSVGRAYDAFDNASSSEVVSIPKVLEPERTVGTGIIDPNTGKEGTKIIPAVMGETKIAQPIYTNDATNKLITRLKPELDVVVANLSKLPADAKAYARLSKLKTTLDNLQAGTVEDGSQVMPWKAVKQLRTDINDAIRYESKLDKSQGSLKALRNALGTDIDTSITTKWANPGSIKELKIADALHSESEKIFNPKVMRSIIEGQYDRVDPSQVYRSAMENPDRAREIIRALGPDEQRMAKGHFFAALDAKAGSNPNEILNQLDSPSYREVFSAHDHSDLTDFFRSQRRVQQYSTDAGNQAGLIWRKAGVAMALAGGAGNIATGGDSNISNYALAGGTLMLGGRTFASKILLNPKYARAAGRLTRVAPSSEEATFLRRVILTGLRGSEAVIKYENGKTQTVKINSNGEPVPIE